MKKMFKKIKKILKKIVFGNILKQDSIFKDANNQIFSKSVLLYDVTIMIFPNIQFRTFWDYFINAIVKEIKNGNERCLKDLFLVSNEREKYIITKLFYFTKNIDDESCKLINEFAKNTTNMSFCYWTTQDISRFTFRLQKGFYDEYYSDRKYLLEKIAKSLSSNTEQTNIKPESINKNTLCIVTHMMNTNINDSVLRICYLISFGLKDYFEKIEIVPLDTFYSSINEKRQLTTVLPYGKSYDMKKEFDKYLPENASVHFTKGKTYKKRLEYSLNEIYQINPIAIIDISDEYSPISYYYSKAYTTYYFPLRGFASSSFYSHILGKKDIFSKAGKRFNSVEDDKVIEFVVPEQFLPNTSVKMDKKDIGADNDDFVLISIGNNSYIFTNDFVDEIMNILSNNEKVKWILVGDNAPEYMHEKYKRYFDKKRIIEWGFEKNLYGLCCACDVLVRANSTGGAGAMLIAGYSGIPIAMTDEICDGNKILGADYSEIHNYKELSEYIEDLYNDKNLYIKKKNETYDKIIKANSFGSPARWKVFADIIKTNEHN